MSQKYNILMTFLVIPLHKLSTNFMTLILSLNFTDYEWFPWNICNGCGMPAGNAYPSGHLVSSPIVGLACALIVETRFLEFAMSLLDFSPRIPLGTFSILLTRSSLPNSSNNLKLICNYVNVKCSWLVILRIISATSTFTVWETYAENVNLTILKVIIFSNTLLFNGL